MPIIPLTEPLRSLTTCAVCEAGFDDEKANRSGSAQRREENILLRASNGCIESAYQVPNGEVLNYPRTMAARAVMPSWRCNRQMRVLANPEAAGVSTSKNTAGFAPVVAPETEVEAAAEADELLLAEPVLSPAKAQTVSAVNNEPRSSARPAAAEPFLRVRTDRLDSLIDIVGELVIAQSMIAQDEPSCVVFGMPKEAIKWGAACKVTTLSQVAHTTLSAGD